MSIVAVHGPQMFGSKAVAAARGVSATVNPADGLVWTFKINPPSDRPAADFDWAFPGGTPATQADSKGPIVVTYAAAGAKTATLTVSGASALEPANGAYPLTVQAVSGAGPSLMMAPPPPEGGGEEGGGESQGFAAGPQAAVAEVEEYDPANHTVKEVLAYADANPSEVQALYDDELEGKERSGILDGLIARGAQES